MWGIEEASWRQIAGMRAESDSSLVWDAHHQLGEQLMVVQGKLERLQERRVVAEMMLERFAPVPWWDFASWIVRKPFRPFYKENLDEINKYIQKMESRIQILGQCLENKEESDLHTLGSALKDASKNWYSNDGIILGGISVMYVENLSDEMLRRAALQPKAA